MSLFLNYLTRSFNIRDLDAEYADYCLSLMEADCSKEDIANWLKLVYTADDCLTFLDEIYDVYQNPQKVVELMTPAAPPALQKFDDGVEPEEIREAVCVEISNSAEEDAFDTDEIIIEPISTEWFSEFDVLDTEFIDWISLASVVESNLSLQFPGLEYSQRIIWDALLLCNGDPSLASQLISLTQYEVSQCRPCRHLLTSRCMRNDCMFDHNLASVPCCFWLLSTGCSKIESNDSNLFPGCPFLHQFPDKIVDLLITGPSQDCASSSESIVYMDDALEFPTLPTTSSDNSNISMTIGSSTTQPMSTVSLKQSKFRMGSASYISPRRGSGRDTAVATRKTREELNSDRSEVISRICRGLQWYSVDGNGVRETEQQQSHWVTTGAVVAREYSDARERARVAAKARNSFLDNATKAYIEGSKQLAHTLAEQGRAMNAEMKKLHWEAARSIFAKRNSPTVIEKGQIDLHGLHQSEAETCLNELVVALTDIRRWFKQVKNKQDIIHEILQQPLAPATALLSHITSNSSVVLNSGKIQIITGSGHHSTGVADKGNVARVLDRARACLSEMGYEYIECKDPNGFIGSICISLK